VKIKINIVSKKISRKTSQKNATTKELLVLRYWCFLKKYPEDFGTGTTLYTEPLGAAEGTKVSIGTKYWR